MPVMSLGFWNAREPFNMAKMWLEAGHRGIDEAWIYNNQQLCSQGIVASGVNRSEIFLTTKVWKMDGYEHARQNVQESLSQLSTHYLDLVLIHWPDGLDMKGTWQALEDFVSEGVIRAIGVSNFEQPHLQELFQFAKIFPVVNQVPYNVLHHNEDLVNFCSSWNIKMQAYSPLSTGDQSILGHPTLINIGAGHSKTAAQVAIRWIVQRGHLVAVLATSEEHQQESADVFDWSLTDSEMAQIDTVQRH